MAAKAAYSWGVACQYCQLKRLLKLLWLRIVAVQIVTRTLSLYSRKEGNVVPMTANTVFKHNDPGKARIQH